jgi:hypothetical protein
MLDRDISDPEHWRERAAVMRGFAIKMLGTQGAIRQPPKAIRLRNTRRPLELNPGRWQELNHGRD